MDPNLQQSWKYPESINCDYFPPGWDLQRLRQATTRELWDLDLEESDRMFASMCRLCVSGIDVLLSSSGNPVPPSSAPQEQTQPCQSAPNFVLANRAMSGGGTNMTSWGFAVYRTAYTSITDEKWRDFRVRFDALLDLGLAFYAGQDGVAEARQRLDMQWIDGDSSLDNANYAEVLERFESALSSLPPHTLLPRTCLSVDAACVASAMRVTLPATGTPANDNTTWPLSGAPFVMAVFRNDDDEESLEGDAVGEPPAKGVKVAIERLLDELWVGLVNGDMGMGGLSEGIGEGQVWCGLADCVERV